MLIDRRPRRRRCRLIVDKAGICRNIALRQRVLSRACPCKALQKPVGKAICKHWATNPRRVSLPPAARTYKGCAMVCNRAKPAELPASFVNTSSSTRACQAAKPSCDQKADFCKKHSSPSDLAEHALRQLQALGLQPQNLEWNCSGISLSCLLACLSGV